MRVTVNFHNHQLKEGAQEGAPEVDQVPDKFCISHSVELAILKPPSFIANWNINYKHTLLRRGYYWYLIDKILNKTLRVINACETAGREKGAISLILSRRLMLLPVRFPFPSFRAPRDTKRPPRGRKEREITRKCSEKAIFRVSLFLQSKFLKATTQNPKI